MRAQQVGHGDRLGLQVVVAQHQLGDLVGHLLKQLVALLAGQVAGLLDLAEQDLDVDLVVGAVDAGRVVDGIGVAAPAGQAVGDAALLGQAQVGALADDLGADLGGVDPERVVGPVAGVGVGFLARLDVGADAAEPQQLDLGGQQGADQLVGRQLVRLDPEAGLDLGTELDRLGLAVEDPAALGDQLGVVVGPGGARRVEEALALGPALGWVRVRVDEDVQVVEGAEQLDVPGQQHAVAEDVARHVADADAGEVLVLDVLAELAEVALDRFPGAARGDAHLLVVVAGRAARGEGVVEPVAVVHRDAVGDVREGRGALVGGDDQVGVVPVVPDHGVRRHQLAGLEVVGDVEQAADEGLVAGDAFLQEGLAPGLRGRRPLDHEAALGADRDDDRVLDLLRLDQAEDLGTEVLAPVRPPEAAARDHAEAQVDALDARAVDEDLAEGARQGQLFEIARIQLERDVGLVAALGVGLEEVGPEGRLDHVEEAPDDPVLVQVADRFQQGLDLGDDLLDPLVPAVLEAGRVEARQEEVHEAAGDLRIVLQGLFHVGLAEGDLRLAQVLAVGPQDLDLAGGQAGPQDQLVEAVVLHLAAPDPAEDVVEGLLDLGEVDRRPVLGLDLGSRGSRPGGRGRAAARRRAPRRSPSGPCSRASAGCPRARPAGRP